MKFIFICITLTAFYTGANAQACCCTSAGGSYSILPNIDEHLVGLRYSYSKWSSTTYPSMNMNMNGMDMTMMGASTPAAENMSTLDVFARFALPKRFFISVFVPVCIKRKSKRLKHLCRRLGRYQYAIAICSD